MVSLYPSIDYGELRAAGFLPAFLDSTTCAIHLARLADGRVATFHSTEGLPNAVVTRLLLTNRIFSVKATLIPGFERNGFFYTCATAARATAEWSLP
jgi:hypothetical protein